MIIVKRYIIRSSILILSEIKSERKQITAYLNFEEETEKARKTIIVAEVVPQQ